LGVVSKIILPLLFLFIELRTAKQNFIFANFFFDEKFKDFGEEPRSGCMKWTGFDFWKQNISSGHSSFRYYNIGPIKEKQVENLREITTLMYQATEILLIIFYIDSKSKYKMIFICECFLNKQWF
jgi:hypothetical protein